VNRRLGRRGTKPERTGEFSGGTSTDTLPKYLLENAQNYPGDVTMRKKDLGIWNCLSWKECFDVIKYFALGLTSLGLKAGDKILIIGDNDPQWYWSELAVQCMGGVAVGVYIDSMPDEIRYLAENSQSVFAIAKDQEQVDKFLVPYKDKESNSHSPIKEELPAIKKLIYWDEKGLWDYQDPWLIKYEDVTCLGKEFEKKHPDEFTAAIARGKKEDTAVLCYTSGTTGLPKGVVVSQDYLINNAISASYTRHLKPYEEYLSFIAPAWIAEQAGIAGWVVNRTRINFPESPDTVMNDLREIGAASLMFGPPQWEGLLKLFQVRVNDSSWLKRTVYNLCLPVGYKVADEKMRLKGSSLFWRVLYSICNLICFRPMRDYLGLSHLKIGITAGALLGPEPLRWYRAIGVSLSQIYGLSEANPVTLPLMGTPVKPETVGPISVGSQIRITEDQEIWVKSTGQFTGYYNRPEATAEKLINGWVCTGDGGTIEGDDGQLVFYDRLQDMLKLRDGTKYSPTYISNAMKFSPYIKDCIAVGGEDKDFIFGIVVIDFDSVGRWAEKNRIAYTTLADLSQKKAVYDLIEPDVRRVNRMLPEAARIRRYLILYKEFDADEGELTRTRKVKRGFIEQRYADLLNAAYTGLDSIEAHARVKYRDGTEREISTTVNIRSVS
jgi:long-chain acyl-CoA synthetase